MGSQQDSSLRECLRGCTSPQSMVKCYLRAFHKAHLPVSRTLYIFLPHWLRAWPYDLLWSVEYQQAWHKVRLEKHWCFGTYPPGTLPPCDKPELASWRHMAQLSASPNFQTEEWGPLRPCSHNKPPWLHDVGQASRKNTYLSPAQVDNKAIMNK